MRSDTRPSSGVNLIAFDSRFHSTCWKRAAIEHGLSESGRDVEIEGHALRERAGPDDPDRRPRDVLHGVTLLVQVDATRLEPGQIAQIVDQLQLTLGAHHDRLDRVGDLVRRDHPRA